MLKLWMRQRHFAAVELSNGSCFAITLPCSVPANSRLVGKGLLQFSQRLKFRYVDGLAERVISMSFTRAD
jgi:hypothetical protein